MHLRRLFFTGLSLLFTLNLSAQPSGNKANKVADELENLGNTINSPYDELGPIISADGKTLYFVVDGHPSNTFGDKDSQDIWFSQQQADGTWTKAQRMAEPLNLDQYNSVESVTPDGNTLIIRGAYKNGRYKGPGFSASQRGNNGWTFPRQLEIENFQEMNKGIFTNANLSNDGRTLMLAFSGTKKSEANDLYVSFKKDDGKWTRPQSLGTYINTPGSEDTPFLASDGVTLYFTSDRPGGLGSHDIYMTKRLDETWQNWSTPKNLGAPINTPDWDTYYSIDATGEQAYLVSGKNSLGGTDIVKVKLKEEFRPEPVVLVAGKVFNAKTKQPLAASIAYENLASGKELGTANSDPASGDYKIVLPFGMNYGFRAVADGFISVSDNIDLSQINAAAVADNMVTDTTIRNVVVLGGVQTAPPVDAQGNVAENQPKTTGSTLATVTQQATLRVGKFINRDLYLVPIEVGQIVRLNNVFFDFDRTELRPESSSELDRVAEFLNENPNVEIEIDGHTDAMGVEEYNLKLSAGRISSVEGYLVSKGISDNRIVVKSFGESAPIADNETEEGRQQNRRVEFKILKK